MEISRVPIDLKGKKKTELRSRVVDVCDNGDLSCAFFVSSVLKILSTSQLELVRTLHATVDGLIKDMLLCGWVRKNGDAIPDWLKNPGSEPYKLSDIPFSAGDIILWGRRVDIPTGMHKHVGFYTGGFDCVSNNPKTRKVDIHDIIFRGTRGIEASFTHPFLKD
jgi:hypothetical protein